MRVGIWNVERGHDPDEHATMIMAAFECYAVDVLMLQEARDYAGALARALRKGTRSQRGHQLVVIDEERGQNQQITLVRGGLEVGQRWSFPAGTGWFTKDAEWHVPQYPLAVVVEGITCVNVHAPVSVDWTRGRPRGPWRRVRAYKGHSRRLVKLFARQAALGRPVLVGGDQNATPEDRGYATPAWIAAKAGAVLCPPNRGTGHGPVDYAIVAGLDAGVGTVRPAAGGFDPAKAPDHFLVTYDLEPA